MLQAILNKFVNGRANKLKRALERYILVGCLKLIWPGSSFLLTFKVTLALQMEEWPQHILIIYCQGCRVTGVPGDAAATPEMDSRQPHKEMHCRHLVTLTNAVLHVLGNALWWAAGIAVWWALHNALMWRSRPRREVYVTWPHRTLSQYKINKCDTWHVVKSYLLSLLTQAVGKSRASLNCFFFYLLLEWKKNVQHSVQTLDQCSKTFMSPDQLIQKNSLLDCAVGQIPAKTHHAVLYISD